jgi:hypothetical protein
VVLDNCHPFQVLNKKDHGRDMWFMHNGIINKVSEVGNTTGKSDTRLFNEQYLQPLLADNPDLIFKKPFQEWVENHIGASKLSFLDDSGRIVRLGNWVEYQDHICSNSHSFSVRHTASCASPYAGGGYPTGRWNDEDYYLDQEKLWEEWDANQASRRAAALAVNAERTVSQQQAATKPASAVSLIKPTDAEVKKVEETKVLGKPESTGGASVPASSTPTPSSRAAAVVQQLKEQVNAAVAEGMSDSIDDEDEGDDAVEMVQVGHDAKPLSMVTVTDLSKMDAEDIYDFCNDYPEKTYDLVLELLAIVDGSYDSVDDSRFYGGYGSAIN